MALTPYEYALVRDSLAEARARMEPGDTRFYERLFALRPDYRKLFRDDIAGQGGPQHGSRRRAEGESSHWDRASLVAYLEETLADVDRVLAELLPDDLLRRTVIQGTDVTYLEALFHAVEHFSMHTGQIIYVAKLRTRADLRFYDVEDGVARKNW